MSINTPYIPVPKELYFKTLQSKLSPTQKTVYLYVAGKIYEWPETRDENAIKLSVRYIGNAIGKQFQHVSSALKSLARRGYLAVTKGVTPSEPSTIRLLTPPVTTSVTPITKSVTPATAENTTQPIENTASNSINTPVTESVTTPSQNPLQNQESKSKNNHQESDPSRSDILTDLTDDILYTDKREDKIRNSSGCSMTTKNNFKSFKESNMNTPVINVLRPAAGPAAGKSEFSALGSVLANIMPKPPVTEEKATQVTRDTAALISDSVLATGKDILKSKNYTGTEIQTIIDRIIGIMKKQRVNSPDKYFTSACEKEKAKATSVSGAPTVEKTRKYVQEFWKEEKNELTAKEIIEKLMKTCPEKLCTVVTEVNNDKKIQKGLDFMPEGEMKRQATENIILNEFKKKYPEIVV